MPGLELDHLLFFIDPGAPEVGAVSAAGLRESFRRCHSGQGTANACFCFDNAFLELLWETDRIETVAPVVARLRLGERTAWRSTGASPFGIALRHRDTGSALPFEFWNYAAPYLPAGTTIPVAVASDDMSQPLLFCSPSGLRPDAWSAGRAGERQRPAGLTEIAGVHLYFRAGTKPNAAIQSLAETGLISLGTTDDEPCMVLTLARLDGCPPHRLSLPTLAWL